MISLETPGLALNAPVRALADPGLPTVPPFVLPPAKPLTLRQINEFWNLGQINDFCRGR